MFCKTNNPTTIPGHVVSFCLSDGESASERQKALGTKLPLIIISLLWKKKKIGNSMHNSMFLYYFSNETKRKKK